MSGVIDASPETWTADLSPTAYGGRTRILVRSLSWGLVEPFPAFKNRRRESHSVTFGMLDKLEKTRQLMAALKEALPFEVELTPDVIAHLRAQQTAIVVKPQQIVSKISYAGDEGGILCHILREDTENVTIISITHIRMHRKQPLAAAVYDYQKHRVKKLRKQSAS